jgi:hypothetical protein
VNDTSTANLVEHRWAKAVKTTLHECKPNGSNFSPFRKAFWNFGVNALRTGPSRTSSATMSRFHDDMRRFRRHVSKSMPRRGHHVHLERQLPSERRRLVDADKEKRPVSCEARRLARDAISGAVKVCANLDRDIDFGKP